MKKTTSFLATVGLLGAYGSAIAGADACLDCHEASEFADMPTAGLVEAVKKMRDENPKHKATAKLSDDDISKIVAELEKAAGG